MSVPDLQATVPVGQQTSSGFPVRTTRLIECRYVEFAEKLGQTGNIRFVVPILILIRVYFRM